MKQIQSLEPPDLASYVARQLNTFFPDPHEVDPHSLEQIMRAAHDRVYRCFGGIRKKYFNEGDRILFDHLHSDQYAMYLYMLANHVHRTGGDPRLATKLYYLNKALHSIDIYFTTQLPDVFLLMHPQGSILGRAAFADGLVVYQGCTIGCLNDGSFPVFEGPAILYAGASVFGPCRIGANVCVAAGVSVINTDIPSHSVVLGRYPEYTIRPNPKPTTARPPFAYGT